MELKVYRIRDNKNDTISAFYIDGVFYSFGVEDEQRTIKVFGETRVPEGKYLVKLRCEGGHYQRYLKKYPDVHKTPEHGMLCVFNQPNWKLENNGMSFQYILIHVGNTDDHTAGCYLPNTEVHNVGTKNANGSGSAKAYKKIYSVVSDALMKGETVTIEYINLEK